MAQDAVFPDRLPISLDMFEGPIDLLLHLVKSNELPIEKVSLALVASQYLECIEQMQRIDFEIAGEYLVVAATLISIKAAVLLKQPGSEMSGATDDGLDPHEELLKKLREAAIYRDGAEILRHRPYLGIDVFEATPTDATAVSDFVLKDHDPMLLGKALRRMLGKIGGDVKSLVIEVDPGTIADRMVSIISRLGEKGSAFSFEDLVVAEAGEDGISQNVIISTFLALLELCKRQIISVAQPGSFEDIAITLTAHVVPTEAEIRSVEVL